MQEKQEIWLQSLGRSLREGNGNPLQYCCLENPMDRGAWWATVHDVAKLSDTTEQSCIHFHDPTAQKFSSVQFSCSVMSDSLQHQGLQHTRLPVHHQLPESTQTHVHWVGDAIQPFYPLSSPSPPALSISPASGSFPMSQFFTSGGQSIGVSASASVLPMNIQDWFPLGLTCLISLQSKGLSKVFSNTTDQKHQFFGTQLSL